jgi:hypothetical protein
MYHREANVKVTIQVHFLLYRLRRWKEKNKLGHPASRQEASWPLGTPAEELL